MSDEEKLDFDGMDDEAILDKFHENPKEFVSLIARQAKADLDRENAQKAQEDQVIKTFQDFQTRYPDFQGMWDSGKIQEFIDQHPGHNVLSGYLTLTNKARIEGAVKAKLAEEGLGNGPLSDTKKRGGTTRILADRLRSLRAADRGKGLPAETAESGRLKPTV